MLLIKFHFSVRVKLYIMLSTFLLKFSNMLVLFLLKPVQILLLPSCSTSRWRWHIKLSLSIRKGHLPAQTARNLLGKDCSVHFFWVLLLLRRKNLATHWSTASDGSNVPVASKRCSYHHLPSKASEDTIYSQ